MRPRLRALLLALIMLLALALDGCGSTRVAKEPSSASLVLDFTPNAVHAGIYTAIARGYDTRAGVHLHIVVPSATTDSIKLLQSGRVKFAILDIHDLAIARERGADIVGIMAVVQRPLAAVIAAPSIRDPRELRGRTVGVTGVPSDTAVLDSVLSGGGEAPERVKTITIGFNAVADLLAGRVAAVTAFWNDEGVTLNRRRPGFHVFRVDQYGAPSYPELMLCATGAGLRTDPRLARSVVQALVQGYRAVLRDPLAGARALETLVPGLDAALVGAQLRALISAFQVPGTAVGELNAQRLRAWARWEVQFGLVRRTPDLHAMFAPQFVASSG